MRRMHNDWGGQALAHPPGRRPIIGDALSGNPRKPIQSMMDRARGLGDLFEFKVFNQQFVFVAGAELCAEMCDEKRFAKALPPAVEALREFGGDGLFTAFNHEPNWQLAHDILMPAFTREAMERYHPVMISTSDELFDYWDRGMGGERIDVSRDMTKLTMETLSRAAFSHDFGSFTGAQAHPVVTAMITALRTGQRKGSFRAMPGAKYMMRKLDRENAPQQRYLDTMLDELIAERRSSGADERDLLGLMLGHRHPQTGQMLDDVNIRHQILTFLVAGHETTSGALSFALYYLATNPDVLRAAQQETDRILGPDRDAAPEYKQVAKFRYLRRVLDETLRLWPTAPGFGRSPREDVTLSNGVSMRPQDWAIVLLPMVHRDSQVWGADACRFDPDRFLPENSRGRPPHSYKPFGTGERACIGRQFAIHEAILVLARLLHRYDIEADPAYELTASERLTLQPEGFELRLHERVPAASV